MPCHGIIEWLGETSNDHLIQLSIFQEPRTHCSWATWWICALCIEKCNWFYLDRLNPYPATSHGLKKMLLGKLYKISFVFFQEFTRFTHEPRGYPETMGPTGKTEQWDSDTKCLRGSFGPWLCGHTTEDLPIYMGAGIGT